MMECQTASSQFFSVACNSPVNRLPGWHALLPVGPLLPHVQVVVPQPQSCKTPCAVHDRCTQSEAIAFSPPELENSSCGERCSTLLPIRCPASLLWGRWQRDICKVAGASVVQYPRCPALLEAAEAKVASEASCHGQLLVLESASAPCIQEDRLGSCSSCTLKCHHAGGCSMCLQGYLAPLLAFQCKFSTLSSRLEVLCGLCCTNSLI